MERVNVEFLFGNLLDLTWQHVVMWCIGGLLIYLAIAKDMEPTLLLPIGFGTLLVNIPNVDLIQEGGALVSLFNAGIANELFPLILFIGIGAMIDFGPLLSNPKLMIFGAAAQFGIFFTLCAASMFFDINDAASIAVIGAADGPTSIVVAQALGSKYLGAIMVAAYSYMALVPIIQPPIIRMLTTRKERLIRMPYEQKNVTRTTRILFPICITVIAALVAPSAASLIGFLMFGNLIRECGVLNSLSETAQKVLANLVTIFLGLTIAVPGPGPCGLHLRHGGRRAVCQAPERLPAQGQEDQPHDRRGGHLGLPDVGPHRAQDGPEGRPAELPADALHRRQRLRTDRLRHRGRPDPDLLRLKGGNELCSLPRAILSPT